MNHGLVGVMHSGHAAQLALGFCGFLGQDVAFERLSALDAATSTDLEALFGAALGLHLGHFLLLYKHGNRCLPAGVLLT